MRLGRGAAAGPALLPPHDELAMADVGKHRAICRPVVGPPAIIAYVGCEKRKTPNLWDYTTTLHTAVVVPSIALPYYRIRTEDMSDSMIFCISGYSL